MEIIIADPTYDHPDKDYKDFISSLKTELKLFNFKFELKETDIGRGADWPVLLCIFGGLFFLGDKINKNLDAWIKLCKKFVKLIRNIKIKYGAFRIDEKGATLLALSHIIKKEDEITSINKTNEIIIQIDPFINRDTKYLETRPDAIYIQTYIINETKIYIIGIKSKGTLEFIHNYSLEWLYF